MKLIKLLIMVLIFSAGVYTGYVYLPKPDGSLKAVVSMPALNLHGQNADDFKTENLLKFLKEKGTEEAVFTRVEDVVLIKDYRIKKAVYETELAKHNPGASPADTFLTAADEYNSAKAALEKRFAARVVNVEEQKESLEESSQSTPQK